VVASREARRFLEGLHDPESVQAECLLRRVVEPNRACAYGRAHSFDRIRTVDDYRRALPIVRYDDLRADVERMARGDPDVLVHGRASRFFLTSGSASAPKLVPVTAALLEDKWKAFDVYWSLLFERHPEARRARVILSLPGRDRGSRTPGGLPCSSESAFWSEWTAAMPGGARAILPAAVGEIESPADRAYVIARILLEEDVSLLMALHPSTIAVLFRAIDRDGERLIDDVQRGGLKPSVEAPPALRRELEARRRGDPGRARELRAALREAPPRLSARAIWPGLRLIACWRSPMLRPYLDLLQPYLEDLPQSDYVTMASEGILAIPVDGERSGGVVATRTHFFEFAPVESAERTDRETLLAHEVDAGRSYLVVLSTSAGLYRYDIGDVVRVNGFAGRTPIIEFLHRAGATCSMTGEKLTEEQVCVAVSAAASRCGLCLDGFTAIPAPQPFPHYVLLAEPSGAWDVRSLGRFAGEIDRELKRRNVEYGSKRESGRLGGFEVWVVRSGEHALWLRRRRRAGVAAEQMKPVHLVRDAEHHRRFEIAERVHANPID
jgi:hypothetical protein